MKKISIFKPYLQSGGTYKGGKTLSEIGSDQKIYKLSSNENPIGPSPLAVAAVQKVADNFHLYPDRNGARLQEALGSFYKNEIPSNQFFTGNSGSEILDFIIRGFLGEGLEAIVCNPAFGIYNMFSGWQGATVKNVPLRSPNFELDVPGILAAITDQTRVLFLTSPNNPTGSYIPRADLDALLDRIPDHVVVVLDEVYYRFADAPDFVTAMEYVKKGHQVIGVNSFSKTYGLAALRIGYGYSTPEISAYLLKYNRPFLLNQLSLEAGIAALTDEDFVHKTVSLVQSERKRIYKQLDKIGIQYWPSQGNFILIKPPMPATEFETAMLKEGIMVRPVANFGAPGCVRVTIGTEEANDAYFAALKSVCGVLSK